MPGNLQLRQPRDHDHRQQIDRLTCGQIHQYATPLDDLEHCDTATFTRHKGRTRAFQHAHTTTTTAEHASDSTHIPPVENSRILPNLNRFREIVGMTSAGGGPLFERGPYPPRQGLVKATPKSPEHLWKTPSVPHVPASPCPTPGCPELRPCPTHPLRPWANSKQIRRARGAKLSTSEEARRRTRILRRFGRICHVCNEPFADAVDHVICLAEGGPDTDDNLRPIHTEPCHRIKTAAEAARGRAQRLRGVG